MAENPNEAKTKGWNLKREKQKREPRVKQVTEGLSKTGHFHNHLYVHW